MSGHLYRNEMIVSNVMGRTANANSNTTQVVGKIYSRYPLDSPDPDNVILELDPAYHGITLFRQNGGNVLTYIKSFSNRCDVDIVSPIITLESTYQQPIYVLCSGIISGVLPQDLRKGAAPSIYGTCSVKITTPSHQRDAVDERLIILPDNIRIDQKIIYIREYDVYIGGQSHTAFDSIRRLGKTMAENITTAKTLVSIHAKGNTEYINTLCFAYNDILGDLNIEPSDDPMCCITLKVGNRLFELKLPNKELINMKDTTYRLWSEYGGIQLLIDTDRSRLEETHKKLTAVGRGKTAAAIDTMNRLNDENSTLREQVADHRRRVAQLTAKLEEAERNERIRQEELKTRREEIKYDASIADNRTATIVDVLKIGGAILGIISLVITLASKVRPTAAPVKQLVEWAVPSLFGAVTKVCANVGSGISGVLSWGVNPLFGI